MFCYNCGKQIPDDTRFCSYCGAAQMQAPRAPASTIPPPVRAAPPNNTGRQSSGGAFAMILTIFTVVMIGCVCLYAKSDHSSSASDTSGATIEIDPPKVPTFSWDTAGGSTNGTGLHSSGSTLQPSPAPQVVDKRIPNYQQTSPPEWKQIRYEWLCLNNRDTMWLEVPIDTQMYAYYRGLERYISVEDYYRYVVDENNLEIVRQIVDTLQEVGNDLSYTDMDMIREVVKFVQDTIEYEYDIDTAGEFEYPRYPIETLYERRGDCEDTSILMAALLKALNYEVGFLHLPEHVAVAVRAVDDYEDSSYYEINGRRYLYIESTGSGWNIGDVPDEFQQIEAEFFPIP